MVNTKRIIRAIATKGSVRVHVASMEPKVANFIMNKNSGLNYEILNDGFMKITLK